MKFETFCDRSSCQTKTHTNLKGVMPKGWYGRYDEDEKKMRRYCSEKCLAETRPEE